MNKGEKNITLKALSKECGISVSTIYLYIKKGLLPRPKRIPNKAQGRGTIALYPRSIIEKINDIRRELKSVHSIEQVRERFPISGEEKKKAVKDLLGELLKKAEKGSFDDEFKEDLNNLLNNVNATASTGST